MDPALKAGHLARGQLIQRFYPETNPTFFSRPMDTPVVDLGFRFVVDSIWGTDFGGDPVVYGLILEPNRAVDGVLDVALCGTRTEVEWIMDALAILDDVPWAPAGAGVKAHRGFLGLESTLRTSKGIPLAAFLAGATVTVSGHSLGAAEAVVLAAHLGAAELIAFAPPRVWNPAGAIWADSRVPLKTLYMNYRPLPDIVPMVPPEWPEPFRHQEGSACRMAVLKAGASFSERHSLPTYLALIAGIRDDGTPGPDRPTMVAPSTPTGP
jgi:hypothetical protein